MGISIKTFLLKLKGRPLNKRCLCLCSFQSDVKNEFCHDATDTAARTRLWLASELGFLITRPVRNLNITMKHRFAAI